MNKMNFQCATWFSAAAGICMFHLLFFFIFIFLKKGSNQHHANCGTEEWTDKVNMVNMVDNHFLELQSQKFLSFLA